MPDYLVFIYEHSPLFSSLLFGAVMAMASGGDGNSRVSRFELMQKDITYIKEALLKVTDDHETRIRGLEKGQRNASIFQAALALVLSTFAAWFGAQR
jgi:hypothetical protein